MGWKGTGLARSPARSGRPPARALDPGRPYWPGSPYSPALGVLGEQPVDEAIERARELAAEYRPGGGMILSTD